MRFWDTSAIVPLILGETAADVVATAEQESPMCVWWGTIVESASAIARRERAGALSDRQAAECFSRLDELAASWMEVPPSDALRESAQRLLRVHALRAADSLQLAAALTTVGKDVRSSAFVCLDERLRQAAGREGFQLLP